MVRTIEPFLLPARPVIAGLWRIYMTSISRVMIRT